MKLLLTATAILPLASSVFALDGIVGIHDPSTIMFCEGKYYVFGTGNNGLMSLDGWTWTNGVARTGGGVAADMIHIGDRYYMSYATSAAQPKAEVHMTWTKTLDPSSPNMKFEELGVVASSDGVEECNAIDPGLFLDPTDGKLWLSYGSYYGFIRLVELDPKTGKRVNPNDKPKDLAVNCEASDMIYRDGWYYLLATHGSCCRGADSGYNIRCGRSRSVLGPYLDNMGIDMIQGGGKLVCGSGGRFVGPGHFGLLDSGDGVLKFSMHWEADLDRGGASVLDIRPLLFIDGWPVAGENFKSGAYEIESVRTGTALELAVEGVPVGGRRARGGGGGGGGFMGGGFGRRGGGTNGMAGFGTNGPGRMGGMGDTNALAAAGTNAPGRRGGMGGGGMFGGSGAPVPPQDVAQVSTNWPSGNINTRMANYLCQAQQKWAITALTNAGGYPGSPYFKITIAGTDRALTATSTGELITMPAFTGAPEQLWRFDQLTDGSWRIMPKAVAGMKEPLALSAIGSSFATLSKFDPASDKQRWTLKAP